MNQTGAFLATLAIEVPLVLLVVPRMSLPRPPLPTIALAALGANAFTHPLLWLADAALADRLSRAPRWALLEGAVVVVEAAVYAHAAGLGRARGLALAFAANALSFVAGWLVAG